LSPRELAGLVAPPATVRVDRSWEEAERDLGLVFSPDFREVLELFGAGHFKDDFVYLRDPRRLTFREAVEFDITALGDPELIMYPERRPYLPCWGEGRRLLPVASDGSAGNLLAVFDDGVQDGSEYWYAIMDDEEYERVDGPYEHVLLALAAGEVRLRAGNRLQGPFQSAP
jgi:hypothetical protein